MTQAKPRPTSDAIFGLANDRYLLDRNAHYLPRYDRDHHDHDRELHASDNAQCDRNDITNAFTLTTLFMFLTITDKSVLNKAIMIASS